MCDQAIRATRYKQPGSVQPHTSRGPFVILQYEREINYLIHVTVTLHLSVTAYRLIAYEIQSSFNAIQSKSKICGVRNNKNGTKQLKPLELKVNSYDQ